MSETYPIGSQWRAKAASVPFVKTKIVAIYYQHEDASPSPLDILIYSHNIPDAPDRYGSCSRAEMDDVMIRTYCDNCSRGRRAGCTGCYPDRFKNTDFLTSVQALWNREINYDFGSNP